MPLYSYACGSCGPFTAMRRLADFDQPVPCPHCGAVASRTLTMPAYLGASARQHAYDGANHAKPSATAHSKPRTPQHGMSCACCPAVKLPASGAAPSAGQGRYSESR